MCIRDRGYYTDKAVKKELDASFIGAKQGVKYSISNNLAIELYEYDTTKLNDCLLYTSIISQEGVIIRIAADTVRICNRPSKGVTLMRICLLYTSRCV